MHVVGELTAAQVDRNGVARNRFERNRHSGMECFAVPGDIIGKSIFCGDNEAIRDI